MPPVPGSYGTDYQWQKCRFKVRSHLVFFNQIILQRKLWANWFFGNFSGISARSELGRGTKELTCHGTGEAGGKFIDFVV